MTSPAHDTTHPAQDLTVLELSTLSGRDPKTLKTDIRHPAARGPAPRTVRLRKFPNTL